MLETVTYLTWMRGTPWSRARQQARQALALVDLEKMSDTRCKALSGGMQRRVWLAQALASEADVLLLDEPFTGLDAPNTESLLELFEELSHRGTSIIMSTHNLSEAAHSCHRLILFNGTVIADDSASRLLRQTDPWTHTFGVRAGSPLLSAIGVSA